MVLYSQLPPLSVRIPLQRKIRNALDAARFPERASEVSVACTADLVPSPDVTVIVAVPIAAVEGI